MHLGEPGRFFDLVVGRIGRPYTMFSRTVPENRNTSWLT